LSYAHEAANDSRTLTVDPLSGTSLLLLGVNAQELPVHPVGLR
jgi:hypothetical protein